MTAFPWTSDVGVSSITAIQALARSSGVQFSTTSSYRPGDPGYHGKSNAVDMATSTTEMAKLAAYLYQYSPYLLELIHSGGSGFFVKNGVRGYDYGATIRSQHYNHVHCATTLSALKAASGGGLAIPATGVSAGSPPAGGCLAKATPVAVGIITLTYTIGDILWRHL